MVIFPRLYFGHALARTYSHLERSGLALKNGIRQSFRYLLLEYGQKAKPNGRVIIVAVYVC